MTIFGDVMTGGKRTPQAVGRGTRDGEVAEALFAVALGTREVRAWGTAFRQIANTRALTNESTYLLSDREITEYLALADALEQLDDTEEQQS